MKTFEQFDDYNLDDIFGKEPELKIISGFDYYIACNINKKEETFSLFEDYGGKFRFEDWEMDPIIKYDTIINLFKDNIWKRYRYEDLPQEIKDRLV